MSTSSHDTSKDNMATRTESRIWKDLHQIETNPPEDLKFEHEIEKLDRSETPYVRQGDRSFDTPRSLGTRRSLHRHPRVRQMVKNFWETFQQERFSNDGPAASKWVTKEEYIATHAKMHKALRRDFNPKEAIVLAEADYARDCKGRGKSGRIPLEQYQLGLFELADLWTLNVSWTEYVSFLYKLFHRITTIATDGTNTRKFKELEDIEPIAESELAACSGQDAKDIVDLLGESSFPADSSIDMTDPNNATHHAFAHTTGFQEFRDIDELPRGKRKKKKPHVVIEPRQKRQIVVIPTEEVSQGSGSVKVLRYVMKNRKNVPDKDPLIRSPSAEIKKQITTFVSAGLKQFGFPDFSKKPERGRRPIEDNKGQISRRKKKEKKGSKTEERHRPPSRWEIQIGQGVQNFAAEAKSEVMVKPKVKREPSPVRLVETKTLWGAASSVKSDLQGGRGKPITVVTHQKVRANEDDENEYSENWDALLETIMSL